MYLKRRPEAEEGELDEEGDEISEMLREFSRGQYLELVPEDTCDENAERAMVLDILHTSPDGLAKYDSVSELSDTRAIMKHIAPRHSDAEMIGRILQCAHALELLSFYTEFRMESPTWREFLGTFIRNPRCAGCAMRASAAFKSIWSPRSTAFVMANFREVVTSPSHPFADRSSRFSLFPVYIESIKDVVRNGDISSAWATIVQASEGLQCSSGLRSERTCYQVSPDELCQLINLAYEELCHLRGEGRVSRVRRTIKLPDIRQAKPFDIAPFERLRTAYIRRPRWHRYRNSLQRAAVLRVYGERQEGRRRAADQSRSGPHSRVTRKRKCA